MTALRSLLFNFCFFSWSVVSAFLFAPMFLISVGTAQRIGRPWANVSLWLARVICGIRYEIRGREYITDAPVIYASKHQSAWDTLIFLSLLRSPAYVLKRELLWLPFWGWYLWRMRMIAIDRKSGASSIKHLIRASREALAESRTIVIFPEGTRTAPGATPHYHPGITALYSQLEVPVVPIALNSGCYWGKNAFTKHAGTILMQFLPPIPPGLAKLEFMAKLQETIETASQQLLEEAKRMSGDGWQVSDKKIIPSPDTRHPSP
jgi:1-acyl-sn-glycerol-3-phosphate acyltransferase